MNWKLFTTAEGILDGMLNDIAAAKNSIDVEQFTFHDDSVGHRILELFEQKNREGVKIRLICDAVGCVPLFLSPYVQNLRKSGVEIVQFNPIRPWRFWELFYRNHKKTMIIDSKIGWIGGVVWKNKMMHFRDTQLRLEGLAVEGLKRGFDHLWQVAQERNFMKELRKSETETSVGEFEILTNGPAIHQKEVLNWLMDKISGAKKYIYITTPYFIPSKQMLSLLANKASSGVDVRILFRGKNDDALSDISASNYFKPTLESGIKIYRYRPLMLHAKTIAIDDTWASVGSTNLNNLSLRLSYEANAVSANPEFVSEVKSQFMDDLKVSDELTLKIWNNRSILLKLVEILTWPLHGYL